MMYADDDALDRALFALPLEEPPAELRAKILTSTIYRPAPPFSHWELAVIGSLTAVLAWLLVVVFMGGGSLFVHSVSAIGVFAWHSLSNLTVLAWLAAGSATAIWLTFFTGSQRFSAARQRVEE
jgi:hypothetical protein